MGAEKEDSGEIFKSGGGKNKTERGDCLKRKKLR